MAATDARPAPIKGIAYRHYFAMRASDGSLLTGWAGATPVEEVSLDGAAYAAADGAATEIGATGTGYIDLIAAEMNTSATVLKVTMTGATPYVVTLYPLENGDLPVNVKQINDTNVTGAGASGNEWGPA